MGTPVKCVESLIAEANEKGLRLNNLFQLRTYPAHPNVPRKILADWQANFTDDQQGYEFGRGDSMVAALEDALRKCAALGRIAVKVSINNEGNIKAEEVDPFS